MKRFDIRYTLRGAGKELDVPNKPNPVEARDIGQVLAQLSPHLPGGVLGLELIGVSVRLVEDDRFAK